jgi:chromate transport protein ChrA
MFDELLAGGATSLLNLIIHAIVMGIVLKMLLGMSRRESSTPQVLQYAVVIVTVGCLLFAAHFLEILLWAYAYAAVGAAPSGTNLVISPSATTRRSDMATCCRSTIGVCLHR